MNKLRCLSSNTIKIIAAISMLIDHIGYLLFPYTLWLRVVGRLAFPIFAFMISEGARYTKNRLRYLLTVLAFGIVCQIPFAIMGGDWHLNIFLTFSLSISLIYALDFFKKWVFDKSCKAVFKALSVLPLCLILILAFYLTNKIANVTFDYGFYGCLTALFASIPCLNRTDAPNALKRLDRIPVRLAFMLIPLFIFSFTTYSLQYASFLAIPLLLLYSGKRGKYNMKYFFYFFYPLHIVILYGISLLI